MARPRPLSIVSCVPTFPGATVERLSAGEAEQRQRRIAGTYRTAGLKPGDRVAFCLGSSAALVCAVLGATRSGIVPVLLNASLTPVERDLLIADAEPSMVIDDAARLAELEVGEAADLAPLPLTRPMHFTSGTTGRPKGVSAGLWDEATAAAVFRDEADLWDFGPRDTHVVCSPLYHSVSVRFSTSVLMSGGSLLVLSRFDATTVLEILRRQRPTTAFMVPSHLQRLEALPGLGADERWPSLRLLVHAGEPCPPHIKEAVMRRCGSEVVWEFYGSTEGQFTVCSPAEWLERPGTVGRARPGRRLWIDQRSGEAPDGDSGNSGAGTIWCEAPGFARFEYWRNPEATSQAWRGPSFTVGDLGRLDEQGYLYLSGRRHDLIISGGTNVYPAEVEAALCEVPGVREAAVFGRVDERWGHRVCAAVVTDPGVDEQVLREVASSRLAAYKRPKEYHLVDELPHTATGKLQRSKVAAQLGLGG